MNKLFRILKSFFIYLFLYRLNKVKYLRSKGMQIGCRCQLVNKITHYGSEPYLIELKDNVTVAANVLFITHDASSRLFRDNIPEASKFGNSFGRILVNENCFIGVGSIILPNIEIGSNSIVGAGSVVTKNIPANTIVAGNPARVLRDLDQFIENYKQDMIQIKASNRQELRKELTMRFWNEYR